jgi:hypothetical protein
MTGYIVLLAGLFSVLLSRPAVSHTPRRILVAVIGSQLNWTSPGINSIPEDLTMMMMSIITDCRLQPLSLECIRIPIPTKYRHQQRLALLHVEDRFPDKTLKVIYQSIDRNVKLTRPQR